MRLLSRELIYTALTRQQDHVVLLHQGELPDLRQYASVVHSESAARMTNLFANPDPVEVDGRFLEAGLIHKTAKGIAVRSKSEVIIANMLFAKGIDFTCEQPFRAPDGSWRSPDFTIRDDDTGVTYYWEHLGMLQRPAYRRKWEQKREWYFSHGVVEEGPQGVKCSSRRRTPSTARSTQSTSELSWTGCFERLRFIDVREGQSPRGTVTRLGGATWRSLQAGGERDSPGSTAARCCAELREVAPRLAGRIERAAAGP